MELTKALELENNFWKTAQNRDSEGFLKLVSPDAVMVCGGYRCLGKEYAQIISMFDCKAYSIDCFEIVNEDESSYQVHYIVKTEAELEENRDLEGTFHVTSTWRSTDGSWQVIFNMDQRIG